MIPSERPPWLWSRTRGSERLSDRLQVGGGVRGAVAIGVSENLLVLFFDERRGAVFRFEIHGNRSLSLTRTRHRELVFPSARALLGERGS